MSTALGPLLGLVRTRPERMAEGFAGPCPAGLPEGLRAVKSPGDPACVPTACGDRGKACLPLAVRSRRRAVAWCAKGDEETRGEDRPGAWARTQASASGRCRGPWCHGVGEGLARLQGGAERGHQGPDKADVGRDAPLICRERHGRLHRLTALSEDARRHRVLATEARKGGTAGQMDGLEGRPLAEKIAEDGRGFVGEPGQDWRDVVFQGAREAVGQPDLVLNQAPAEVHALVPRAPRGAVRSQHLQCIAVVEEPFELHFGIRGGILSPPRREGCAVFGHRQRVDGEPHQAVMRA
jgi:hypothetical protein